jgi:phosphoribosylamine--glycine ligase
VNDEAPCVPFVDLKFLKVNNMKILVIGGGGREHALAWKAAQNEKVSRVYVAPGNAGTALDPDLMNVPVSSVSDLVKFVQDDSDIYLTIVGPEAPLSQGVVDAFRAAGLKIFGPTKAAAQLESSKDFAKAFMVRHNIPTAAYATFTDAQLAHDYVKQQGAPIVIKADGLAAGKGVVVAMHDDEAHAAIDAMLADNKLGAAGARVVIEEFLQGEEASFIVMVDGKNILPLATSQDHKRLQDNDLGPNTGGMGAYSPAPVVTPEIHARVMREIITPTVEGMAKDGIPYTGFLYAGLMISPNGSVKTLEFNCRMGDPETQPIMLRLKSDLVALADHAINGTLDKVEAEWDRRTALGVVMASANYPDTPRLGDEITGLPKDLVDAHVFHAGTTMKDGKVLTSGGRVLCVTALGETVKFAQQQAYKILNEIKFDGEQHRTDIGYRAIKG